MKKAISLLLVILMMMSIIPTAVFAADVSITAQANATEAKVGDKLEVTFTIADNPGVSGFQATLTYDDKVLQFTGLKENEGLFSDADAGTAIAWDADADVTENGTLFVALFDVIAEGNTAVGLNVVELYNWDLEDFVPTVSATETITVSAPVVEEPQHAITVLVNGEEAELVAFEPYSWNGKGYILVLEELAEIEVIANDFTFYWMSDGTYNTRIKSTDGKFTAENIRDIMLKKSALRNTAYLGNYEWQTDLEWCAQIDILDSNYMGASVLLLEIPVVEATEIAIPEESLALNIGDETTLSATITPEETTDKRITWSSDTESVAKVDQTGKVTAVGAGTATITAKCGTVTDTCTVTVSKVPVTGITLNQTEITLTDGEEFQLEVTFDPENASDKGLLFTISEGDGIASVSDEGKITALDPGTAKVAVYALDSEDYSIVAYCTVTVNPVAVEGVDIEQETAKAVLNIQDSYKLKLNATVSPENASVQEITWSSSDEAVATVDAKGVVTGKKIGKATITATVVDGDATHTDTCEVEVVYPFVVKAGDQVLEVVETDRTTTGYLYSTENVVTVTAPAGTKAITLEAVGDSSSLQVFVNHKSVGYVYPSVSYTYTMNGLTGYVCLRFITGDGSYKHIEIEVLPCEHEETEILPGKDATVEETGLTEGEKCLICDEILVEQKVLPKLVAVEEGKAEVSQETVTGAIAVESETVKIDVDKREAVETTEIGKDAIDAVITADKPLEIETKDYTVTLDKSALEAVQGIAGDETPVSINVKELAEEEIAELTEDQQAIIEEKNVAAVISMDILCGEEKVESFDGGKMTVRIPFELQENEVGEDYVVLFIADDGTISEVPSQYVDGSMVMELAHLSDYAIAKVDYKFVVEFNKDVFLPGETVTAKVYIENYTDKTTANAFGYALKYDAENFRFLYATPEAGLAEISETAKDDVVSRVLMTKVKDDGTQEFTVGEGRTLIETLTFDVKATEDETAFEAEFTTVEDNAEFNGKDAVVFEGENGEGNGAIVSGQITFERIVAEDKAAAEAIEALIAEILIDGKIRFASFEALKTANEALEEADEAVKAYVSEESFAIIAEAEKYEAFWADGDVNVNGVINAQDISALLSVYGRTDTTGIEHCDINRAEESAGEIDGGDLSTLLPNYGRFIEK